MAMDAAGAYVQALRKARGLSRVTIATLIGTDAKQVYVWELGKVEPVARFLVRLTAAVAGDPRHVHALILDDTATPADGMRLAALQLELEERGL